MTTGTFIKTGFATTDTAAPKVAFDYAYDDFNRANGAPGNTPVGGYAWTNRGTIWNIVSNALEPTGTTTATSSEVYIDEPHTDGTLETVLTKNLDATLKGVYFRGQADTAGYLFYAPEAGVYALRSRSASGALATIQASTQGFTAGDKLTVVLNGSTITCKVNNTAIITVTDTQFSGTRKGLWAWKNGGTPLATYDYFAWSEL